MIERGQENGQIQWENEEESIWKEGWSIAIMMDRGPDNQSPLRIL